MSQRAAWSDARQGYSASRARASARPTVLQRLLVSTHPLLFLSLALGSHITGWTQTALPDAGSIRQQIEQQRTLPLPQALPPQSVAPPPEVKLQTGVVVRAKAFQFAGNTLLGDEQLASVLVDFVNRELDFAGLQRVADAVAAAYRQAGWLVRVYLPEQDISEGVITLQVVEAKFAGLRSAGEASKRVRSAEIEAYFKARQVGQPLNTTVLDRALLLADDLPGVSVAGTLVPGQADGETALALQTTDEPLIYGDVGLDNTGSRWFGSDRLTLNMAINSPGGWGELLSLNLLHTQGSDYSRVAFTMPAGYDGLRLGVNASELNYQVIDGPSANSVAQIKGNSGSLGLTLSYPLVRARAHNLYLSAGLDHKSFYTSDTQVSSDYESDSLSAGLSGNRFDDFGGGGANSASLQMLWGRLTDMQAHNLKDTIGRDYNKLSYSFSRQQTLTIDHSLLVSLQGQYASQLLDSSEKFYIGGAQTVRAYPSSELGGERGQVLSGEWRWRLTPVFAVSAFIDIGRVVALAATATDQDSTMTLRGHGLSIAWQTPLGLSTRLTWARRDGSHPKPTLTGLDGDGTLKKDRVWITASLPF